MRHLPGQAARHLWIVTHRLLSAVLAVIVLGLVLLGLFAWRLSQGPLELAWLARRMEAAANTQVGATLAVGSAALAWEGFRGGVDRPLDIRLRGIVATDATGTRVFAIPSAEISLSLRGLLLGRVEPRAIELHNATLRAQRAADGGMTIDLGAMPDVGAMPNVSAVPETGGPAVAEAGPSASGNSPAGVVDALVAELARPAASDLHAFRQNRFSQLRRVLITDSALTVVDRQLGVTWRAPRVDIDLRRRAGGGVDGTADIALAMGAEKARLRVSVTLAADARSGHASASLSPVQPAALAKLSPSLAALGLVDAPVTLDARIDLGAALAVREGVLEAHLGTGRLMTGVTPIVLRQGSAVFGVTADTGSLRQLRLEVAPRDGGPVSLLSATGSLGWDGARLRGRGQVELDRVAFTDLDVLWPAQLSPNARTWITRNITAGTARDARVEVALDANADLSDAKITEIKGGLEADDLAVHWLPEVPQVDRLRARMTISDPDTMEITATAGRQLLEGPRGGAPVAGGLNIPTARVRITGLSQKDQVAQVDVNLVGPVAETVALLRHPRLRLLDRSPFELKDPAGSLNARIAVTVPLEHNLALEDLTIRVQGHTEGLRLAGLVAGRDLEQGSLDLDVTTEAMKISGRATVGGIAAQLTADLDFRPGGPAQIQQRVTANARADLRQLAAVAGLDLGGMASGPATAQITYARRRDGGADMRVGGELRDAELRFAPLAWRKPPGQQAGLEARLRIQRDRITAIDDIALTGEALNIRGRMEQRDGQLSTLRLDRAMLGGTEAEGSVHFRPNGGRISVSLQGASLDLGPRLTAPLTPPPDAPAVKAEPPERPWSLEARFETAHLANDVRLAGFTATAESNGTVIQRLRVDGRAEGGAVHLEIAPGANGRRLSASSADAGTLLRGLDVARKLAGGTLIVAGSYDDRAADRPLTGTARIENFRVMNAPAVTGLLQAMTLYGLVQMAQGPGLGITRLIAPFRMTDTALDLIDARAFNSSLGMTIKGRIDRVQETCDLAGTIVPAYFFNSLLGDIPLIGKLFAPEAGGGLFAASYSLRGKLSDPQVAVNPLAALTPGFLRGLFDGF